MASRRSDIVRTDCGVRISTAHAAGCEGCEQLKRLATSSGLAEARAAYLAGDWDALERALGISLGPDGPTVSVFDLAPPFGKAGAPPEETDHA